jgi:hypothetical protein
MTRLVARGSSRLASRRLTAARGKQKCPPYRHLGGVAAAGAIGRSQLLAIGFARDCNRWGHRSVRRCCIGDT